MGIDLLFIGFPGHEHVAIMKHYALIDKEDPDSMIDLLLNVAKLKAKTGRLPPGNLGKHFDMARHGARNEASHEIARREAAKRRTLARKAAAEPRLEQQGLVSLNLYAAEKKGKNTKKQIEAAGKVMPELWKETTKDIVILPETSNHRSRETGARKEMRELDKKYAQSTSSYGIYFQSSVEEQPGKVFSKRCGGGLKRMWRKTKRCKTFGICSAS